MLQEGEIERLGDHKTRKVNVRIIAATNDELRQRVKEGRFRSDLYYRLNAYQVNIPPLRERKEDISLLAKRFLEKYSALHAQEAARLHRQGQARAAHATRGRATSANCRTRSSAA